MHDADGYGFLFSFAFYFKPIENYENEKCLMHRTNEAKYVHRKIKCIQKQNEIDFFRQNEKIKERSVIYVRNEWCIEC